MGCQSSRDYLLASKILSRLTEHSYASVAVCTQSTSIASAAKTATSRTRGSLYSENTLIERLPQDFQNMAMELRQFIQEEHAVVREGQFTRHRHVAPPISAA
jgi:hypothetical protein